MQIKISLAVIILALSAVTSSAEHRQTIVGHWATVGPSNLCNNIAEVVSIRPMSILISDDYACLFKTVSRTGDDITWTGACGIGDEQEPAIVIAKLRGEKLTFAINGNNNGPYRRCP